MSERTQGAERAPGGAPEGWLLAVKGRVDERLRAFFEERRRAAGALAGPEAVELARSVEALTLRGGKRLRPAVLVAAYCAVDEEGAWERCLSACAALELLQSHLLIHDDWMDGDDERRGGPSVHAALRRAHGDDHLGASLAILAGNLANTWGWGLLLAERAFPEDRRARAVDAYLEMQRRVVYGQQLDLLGTERVGDMVRLKTGSYTVQGPLRLGACLAGANDAQLEALRRFGEPLGEAFQIRDDLLGTFGDPRATGKPNGSDLRAGKRSSLVRMAETTLAPEARVPLEAVLRRAEADEVAVRRARRLLEEQGVREAVERRLDRLLERSTAALEGAPLTARGRAMLGDLARRMAVRDR